MLKRVSRTAALRSQRYANYYGQFVIHSHPKWCRILIIRYLVYNEMFAVGINLRRLLLCSNKLPSCRYVLFGGRKAPANRAVITFGFEQSQEMRWNERVSRQWIFGIRSRSNYKIAQRIRACASVWAFEIIATKSSLFRSHAAHFPASSKRNATKEFKSDHIYNAKLCHRIFILWSLANGRRKSTGPEVFYCPWCESRARSLAADSAPHTIVRSLCVRERVCGCE